MRAFTRFWQSEAEQNFMPSVPAGLRLYAIGDVHGCDALLGNLLDRIASDSRGRRRARIILVFLGDLIDRGPRSADVIERLIRMRSGPAKVVGLMGNHEEVLLRILDGDDNIVSDWLRFGGDACMTSYGIDGAALVGMGAREAGQKIRSAVPPAHRTFLAGLADSFQIGDYLFVHAGIRPGVSLIDQSVRDLRWIRSPFLDHDERHEYVVVHGHTISDEVVVTTARIGVDTGAYCSGRLSAVGFEGTERWIIQSADG